MNFFNMWAFVGLLTIPVIIIMYLLKQKYKDVKISSLFLWKKAEVVSLSQKPWQRLRRNILMFVQIGIALLLTLALANPYVKGMLTNENYIIVLDTSMSMQAKDVLPTRFEKAKEDVKELVLSSGKRASFSIISANNKPHFVVDNSQDKYSVIKALEGIEPSFTSMDTESLKPLIKLAAKHKESVVTMFTDKKHDLSSDNIKYAIYGSSVGNTAITLMSHSLDADKVVCLVKVKNFGVDKISNTLSIHNDGAFHDSKDIELNGGEEKDYYFTTLPPETTTIEARLTREDILIADDSAFNAVSRNDVKKVLYFSEQNVFLENVLSLMPNIEMYKGNVNEMENLSGYYLYIFDGVLPRKMPIDGHILVLNPPIGNDFIETNEEVKVSQVYSGDSNLLKFINNMDFAISKTKSVSTSKWSEEVLTSDVGPLILAGKHNKQKVVIFTFDLHNTDLPLKKEFPIFMYNLIEYFIPSQVASEESVFCGDAVELNVLPYATSVKALGPGGSETLLAPPFPPAPFTKTNNPGIYILEQETEEGSLYTNFSINVSKGESNLILENNDINSENGFNKKETLANINITFIFLLAALLLLLVEWWVYCYVS